METRPERTDENITPQFWYEWGDERPGEVSVGAWDKHGVLVVLGTMRRADADRLNLQFENPYA